ncbi:MAG: ribosome biogenesis GTP-binding protein YihA/YsxC, partial [Janthinobacterium lividum]
PGGPHLMAPGRRPWRPGTARPGDAVPGAASRPARRPAGKAAARPAPGAADGGEPAEDAAPPGGAAVPHDPAATGLPAAFAGLPELSEDDADDWDDAPDQPILDDAPAEAHEPPLGHQGGPSAEQIEAGRVLFAANCRFFYAAQRSDQLPEPRGPEIAFAGRSNVGKSSLINALANHHGLARASNQPGRTRQLNFFDLGERLTLVDMPGYGYAQAAKEVKRDWQGLMLDFLRGRPTLQRVVLLLDSRIELKGSDEAVMELLDLSAVTFQIVLTKTDGTKPAALARKLAQVRGYVREHAAAHPDIIATSSTTFAGIPELRATLATLALPKQS